MPQCDNSVPECPPISSYTCLQANKLYRRTGSAVLSVVRRPCHLRGSPRALGSPLPFQRRIALGHTVFADFKIIAASTEASAIRRQPQHNEEQRLSLRQSLIQRRSLSPRAQPFTRARRRLPSFLAKRATDVVRFRCAQRGIGTSKCLRSSVRKSLLPAGSQARAQAGFHRFTLHSISRRTHQRLASRVQPQPGLPPVRRKAGPHFAHRRDFSSSFATGATRKAPLQALRPSAVFSQ